MTEDARSGRARRRRLRRRLRRQLARPLLALAGHVLPPLYALYMRLVWATSRVHESDMRRIHDINAEHDGVVALLWHEEVLGVAYAYPFLGFRPHTLASAGDAGEVITRILERCGFVVFRGGSSSTRNARRRPLVVREMIEHMRKGGRVLYGLTVDGSRGPAYRMKRGGISIARSCGRPVVLVRTWYRRCLRRGSWDRTAIPLPFNEIHYYWKGPYFPPDDDAALDDFALEIEGELIDLAARSYAEAGQDLPEELRRRDAGVTGRTGSPPRC